MAIKPEWIEITAIEHQCSACEFKMILDHDRETGPGQRQRRLDNAMAEHIRQRHSENMNQIAETTKD